MVLLYPCSIQYLEAGLGNCGVEFTVGTRGTTVCLGIGGVSSFAASLHPPTTTANTLTVTINNIMRVRST